MAHSGSLSQSLNGLVFRDNFNRANSDTIGNGWSTPDARADDTSILNNQLNFGPDFDFEPGGARHRVIQTASLETTEEGIYQCNWTSSLGGTWNPILAIRYTSDSQKYAMLWDKPVNNLKLMRAGEAQRNGPAGSAPFNVGDIVAHRLVSQLSGSGIQLGGWIVEGGSLANLQDLSVDPVLAFTTNFAAPTHSLGQFSFEGISNQVDEFFYCGRNVVVIGVPTGSHARFEGQTGVSESNNRIIFDVDGYALPIEGSMSLFLGPTVLSEFLAGQSLFGGSEIQFVGSPSEDLQPGTIHGKSSVTAQLGFANVTRSIAGFAHGQSSTKMEDKIFLTSAHAAGQALVNASRMRQADIPASIERFKQGLVFLDEFSGSAGPLGNDWVVDGPITYLGGGTILITALSGPSTASMWRGPDQGLILPSESVIHIIGPGSSFGVAPGLTQWSRADEPYSGSLRNAYDVTTGGIGEPPDLGGVIDEVNSGSSTTLAEFSSSQVLALLDGQWRSVYSELSPSSLGIAEFFSSGSSRQDLDGAILQATASSTHSFGIVGVTAVNGFGLLDEYYVCGRNIQVNGLEAGQKIRFINNNGTSSFVEESAGTASVNIDALALPGNRVEVYESDETTFVIAFQSESDIWGGDCFNFTAAAFPVTSLAGTSHGEASVQAQLIERAEAMTGHIQGQSSAHADGPFIKFQLQALAAGQAIAHSDTLDILGSGGTINQFKTGLVERDQFNRADSPTVGNGWIEDAPGYEILNNELRADSGFPEARRIPPPFPVNYIMQTNTTIGEGLSQMGVLFTDVSNFLTFQAETNNNRIRLRYRQSGSESTDIFNVTLNSGDQYALRAVRISASLADEIVFGYSTSSIANLQDLSKDLDLTNTFEVSGSGRDLLNAQGPMRLIGLSVHTWDEFFVCGLEVQVTDLPTGFKARLIGPTFTRSAAVEVAGTGSIDVRSFALPATSIEVLTAADEPVGILTPSGGIWGGDCFNLAPGVSALAIIGTAYGQSFVDGFLSSAFRIGEGSAFGLGQAFADLATFKTISSGVAFGQAFADALLTELIEELPGKAVGRSSVYGVVDRIRGMIGNANGSSTTYALIDQIAADELTGESVGSSQVAALLSVSSRLGQAIAHGQAQADGTLAVQFVADFIGVISGEATTDAFLSLLVPIDGDIYGQSQANALLNLNPINVAGTAYGEARVWATASGFFQAGLVNSYGQSLVTAWLGFKVEFLGQAPILVTLDDAQVEQVTLTDPQVEMVTLDDDQTVIVYIDRN